MSPVVPFATLSRREKDSCGAMVRGGATRVPSARLFPPPPETTALERGTTFPPPPGEGAAKRRVRDVSGDSPQAALRWTGWPKPPTAVRRQEDAGARAITWMLRRSSSRPGAKGQGDIWLSLRRWWTRLRRCPPYAGDARRADGRSHPPALSQPASSQAPLSAAPAPAMRTSGAAARGSQFTRAKPMACRAAVAMTKPNA